MKKNWYYETLCHCCGKVNGWLLTVNHEQGEEAKKMVNNHKVYSSEYPFDIRNCNHCHKETRQERVSWYSKKIKKLV